MSVSENYSGAYFEKKGQQSGQIQFKPWSVMKCDGTPRLSNTQHFKRESTLDPDRRWNAKHRRWIDRPNREQRIVASRAHMAQKAIQQKDGQ